MRLSYQIDQISYEIGMINSFIEMVACGVKRLAISPPIDPSNINIMLESSEIISDGFSTKYRFEESLIVTDIQSAEFTEGKNSILYYATDDAIAEYLDLKEKIKSLTEKNQYFGQKRREISFAFGRLLGYPDEVILRKIDSPSHIDPFVLI
ncbi:MAG TPA: hypothetical protein PKX58_05000 [Flexilinea sp.]|jgi:hypothetical protein|nr:hypothetical protein [Flexilinea sp.]HOP01541.1 hypothetical protein [Flexilinea sp.]HPJ65385.1 hypothetical protein [Flexilinea sp.]HPR71457.1 hypothetical protein [Flexilinea sp.]